MTMKRLIALLIAAVVLLVSGCSAGVQSSAKYDSVVALSKTNGEMWLLAGGELKGITDDGLELEGASSASSVGTITKPNLESIIALEPDLVLLSGELSSHAEIKNELDGLGIKTIEIVVDSFDDYDSYMRTFTELTGRDDLYEQNVVNVRSGIESVTGKVPSDNEVPTYLAMRVSATKNKVLKNDYFACDIFNDIGLHNAVTDDSALDELSAEWIAGVDPDIIFVVLQGEDEEATQSFRQDFESSPSWSGLSAVQNGKVFILPKEYFQYKPNAQWAAAYEYVYNLIYEG